MVEDQLPLLAVIEKDQSIKIAIGSLKVGQVRQSGE